jgi:hypothetical protein
MADVINCAVTQGPFPADGGGIVHPAMLYVLASVATGCPETSTRGFVVTGTA